VSARTLGVVPARVGSTRFPGKPLFTIGGRSVLEHAWLRLAAAPGVDLAVVATDDAEVARLGRSFGAEVFLSSKPHRNGTERAAELAAEFDGDVVVNLQIDQPFLSPAAIGAAVAGLRAATWASMSTLVRRTLHDAAAREKDGVTVVVAPDGRALYFSRAKLPPGGMPAEAPGGDAGPGAVPWVWEHIGLYCYRNPYIRELAGRAPTPLELVEGLEQLRALESGAGILAVATTEPSFCFHRMEEVPEAEAFLSLHHVPGRVAGGRRDGRT
jgi:3-deoxy-manno-octulosonate cytidylyltransferase (CMP-KDO synthetase)